MKPQMVLALVALTIMAAQAVHAGRRNPRLKPASAPITTLSEHDKRHLFRDAFTVVRTVQGIPEQVQRQLFHGDKDSLNGMVDPGQEYQATDVFGPKVLPYRRLIYAAVSRGCCLVYYQSINSGQRVDVFRSSGGRVSRAWAGELMWEQYRPLTLTELRAQIKMGRYVSVRGGEWFPPMPQ